MLLSSAMQTNTQLQPKEIECLELSRPAQIKHIAVAVGTTNRQQ